MWRGRLFAIMLSNSRMGQSMSDASRFTNSIARSLRPEERDLIASLLSRAHPKKPTPVPSEAQVVDMQDGWMGGIRFAHPDSRHFGAELARGEYLDSDGVLVSIAINADDRGELFELDFWNVDFSPLKRYPRPQD